MAGIFARVGGSALAVGVTCAGSLCVWRWLVPPPPPRDLGDALATGVGPWWLGFLGIFFLTAPLGVVIGWLWVVVQVGREQRRRPTNEGTEAR